MPLLRPRVFRRDKPGAERILVSTAEGDSILAAIVKWIPVEVITVYKFLMGLIPQGFGSARLWTSVALVPICFLWIAFATRPDGARVAWRQAALAPFAFACWVVALQDDVMKGLAPGWQPWMGSVVLGVGALLLPILDGILRSLGVPQN
jgi:hypothetical protein